MRRFNYTGRKRLNRSDVVITLHPQADGGLEFDSIVDLAELRKADGVQPDAPVFLEAYSRTKFERFDLGTLEFSAPATRHRLTSFRRDENVLFRLKVVDSEAHEGRIIAMASGIRPVAPQEARQSSLLPVSVKPLDDLVFLVDFEEDGPPTLVLNERLDVMEQGIKAAARNAVFIALVLPEAVRQILTRILVIEDDTGEDEDALSWSAKWKRFARSLNPEPIPELEDDQDPDRVLDWIDVVVSRIGRNLNVIQKFEQGMTI
jgi:hypothetical protein